MFRGLWGIVMAFDKKAYDKEYARKHRDKINSATKRWREAHPEEWKEKNAKTFKRWAEKNREKDNAYQREWRRSRKEALAKKEKA